MSIRKRYSHTKNHTNIAAVPSTATTGRPRHATLLTAGGGSRRTT